MCYRDKVNIKYTSKFDNTLKKNSNSKSSSNMSNLTDDDIYGKMYYVDNNNVINPFKIVEEEQLKLVKALAIKMFIKRRAEDYGKWFDVAQCQHNINVNLLMNGKNLVDKLQPMIPMFVIVNGKVLIAIMVVNV